MNPWDPPSNSDSSDEALMIIETTPEPTKEDAKIAKDGTASRRKKQPVTQEASNSEEDDVIILDADTVSCKSVWQKKKYLLITRNHTYKFRKETNRLYYIILNCYCA